MKREMLEVQEALHRGTILPFGWVCTLSKVMIGPVSPDLTLEELIEARLFDNRKEIRLFRQEGELSAAALTVEPDDLVIEKAYSLRNAKRFGSKLIVRKILDVDEDGQCYVAATMLAGWEGGSENA